MGYIREWDEGYFLFAILNYLIRESMDDIFNIKLSIMNYLDYFHYYLLIQLGIYILYYLNKLCIYWYLLVNKLYCWTCSILIRLDYKFS
jgi:hypothetical protein